MPSSKCYSIVLCVWCCIPSKVGHSNVNFLPQVCIYVPSVHPNYVRILPNHMFGDTQAQMNLLQSTFALGRNWSVSKIRAFAYCMAHHSHCQGEFIYRQGEPAHNLYIVYRGKVRVRLTSRRTLSTPKSSRFLNCARIPLPYITWPLLLWR